MTRHRRDWPVTASYIIAFADLLYAFIYHDLFWLVAGLGFIGLTLAIDKDRR